MSLNIQPGQKEHRWSDLARRRMKADYLQANQPALSLDEEYQELIEAYDQAGLPLERVLTRVRYACYIAKKGQGQSFAQLLSTARNLAQSHHMEPLLRQINLIPHPVPR